MELSYKLLISVLKASGMLFVIGTLGCAALDVMKIKAQHALLICAALVGCIGLVTVVEYIQYSAYSYELERKSGELRIGSTKEEVIKLLGTPETTGVDQDKEFLSWSGSSRQGIVREFFGITTVKRALRRRGQAGLRKEGGKDLDRRQLKRPEIISPLHKGILETHWV